MIRSHNLNFSRPTLQSSTPLPAALRDLYKSMSRTTDSILPHEFLEVLREVNPQFRERQRSENPLIMLRGGGGYAQQGRLSFPPLNVRPFNSLFVFLP